MPAVSAPLMWTLAERPERAILKNWRNQDNILWNLLSPHHTILTTSVNTKQDLISG